MHIEHRISLHETTEFTSYHLNLGRSLQLPIDVMLGLTNTATSRSYLHFITQAHQHLTQAYKLAWKHVSQYHLRQKAVHNSKGTAVAQQIGEIVWLHNPEVHQGNTNKFTSFWHGPYTIIDKIGPINNKLQLLGGTQAVVVYRNCIKLCHNACQCLPSESTANCANKEPLQFSL